MLSCLPSSPVWWWFWRQPWSHPTPRASFIAYTPDYFFRLLCLLPAEADCKISLCSDFSDWCIRNYQDKVSYFIWKKIFLWYFIYTVIMLKWYIIKRREVLWKILPWQFSLGIKTHLGTSYGVNIAPEMPFLMLFIIPRPIIRCCILHCFIQEAPYCWAGICVWILFFAWLYLHWPLKNSWKIGACKHPDQFQ